MPTHVYTEVFQGFAAELPAAAVRAAERQPGVIRDLAGPPGRALSPDAFPTGVNRVNADQNPWADIDGSGDGIDADVAVLDTGIDTDHPDLDSRWRR